MNYSCDNGTIRGKSPLFFGNIMATSREKKQAYVKQRVKGKSIRKAAKASGVPVRTACRIEKDPQVKSAMARALEKVGCTDKKIATTVLEALDATKVISANIIINQGKKNATADEQDGMKPADVNTKDFVDVPDYQARIKAAELAGKFRGDFVEKSEVKHTGKAVLIFEG